ncbi:hypothetical protein [Isoptericola jiangsuensis]|uniref:hypothetical protein n=1 Tax=Isoptericola jiangsuensis TaxID=548579 RepID=UPI000BF55D97|nr:hypothetical protein [Isoptericola jiangsuensis]
MVRTVFATASYALNLPVGPGQDEVPAAVEHLAARLRRDRVAAEDVIDIGYRWELTDDGVDLPGFSVTVRRGPRSPGSGGRTSRTPAAPFTTDTSSPGTESRQAADGDVARIGGYPSRTVLFRLPEGPGLDSVPDLLEGLADTLREWEVGAEDLLALTHVHGCDAHGNPRPGFLVTLAEPGDDRP